MTRAAIYARISDDRTGEGLGVERQVRDCRRLAADKGWTVVEEYVDNDLSAYRGKKRPGFEALLTDLEARGLDAVVTYHQDRLTRSPAEFEQFLAICQGAGVKKFTTVTGYTDLGQGDGVMVARIFAAVAANESDAKSRRVRRKNDERAEKGLTHATGQRPFGYEPGGMVVCEDEAAVIRACVQRFIAGESISSLVAWLDDKGVTTATGTCRWRSPTLRNLLKSPRIAGLREHRGHVVGPAAWPAIITEREHRQVLARLADPSRRTLRTPRRYVLSGLVRCGLCGAKMVSAPDSGRRRYGCRSGADFEGCGKIYVSGDALDALIADAVLLRLDTSELAAALAGRNADDGAHQAAAEEARLSSEQLDELAAAYASRVISMREWLTARRTIETRKRGAERRLAQLQKGDILTGLVGNGAGLRAQWDTLSLSRQAAIISSVLDHVLIDPAERASNRLNPARVRPVWRR